MIVREREFTISDLDDGDCFIIPKIGKDVFMKLALEFEMNQFEKQPMVDLVTGIVHFVPFDQDVIKVSIEARHAPYG